MTRAEVRALAMALPGVEEREHHGRPSFRTGGRIFSTLWDDPPRVMLKLPIEEQAALLAEQPGVFERAAGAWGRSGSTLVLLEAVDPVEFEELLRLAYTA